MTTPALLPDELSRTLAAYGLAHLRLRTDRTWHLVCRELQSRLTGEPGPEAIHGRAAKHLVYVTALFGIETRRDGPR